MSNKIYTDFSDIPKNKYNIIYADPPWEYKDKANAGKRGASHKYETQPDSWVWKLPVTRIYAHDCIIFLWVTFPKLQAGLNTLTAWGFTYKTVGFVWVKKNKVANTNFFGMGNYTRSNAEVCLIGITGKPKRISAKVSSVIEAKIERHSKKPDIVRDKIVELCGDKPRIELFARDAVIGWDCWGNEVNG